MPGIVAAAASACSTDVIGRPVSSLASTAFGLSRNGRAALHHGYAAPLVSRTTRAPAA